MSSPNARDAAHREVDALAARRGWGERARSDAHELIEIVAGGTTGAREIGNRYRALARSLDRNSRARLWQVVRRTARSAVRTLLDGVYRNVL
jgi:hypothetical protein